MYTYVVVLKLPRISVKKSLYSLLLKLDSMKLVSTLKNEGYICLCFLEMSKTDSDS